MKSVLKFALAILMVVGNIGYSTAQLYSVPLAERVYNAEVIVEGEVFSKTSFWDAEHRNIYTSNIIEVYKVFKGTVNNGQIEIITIGGIVGDQMLRVTHSLQLNVGDLGVFTCIPNEIEKEDKNINSGYSDFKVYASQQGFIRYDLKTMTANDVFNEYTDVKNAVYPAITGHTKQEMLTVKNVDLYKWSKGQNEK